VREEQWGLGSPPEIYDLGITFPIEYLNSIGITFPIEYITEPLTKWFIFVFLIKDVFKIMVAVTIQNVFHL